MLVHLVEATFTTGPDRDPLHDFDVINRELARYAPELAAKPQIVALNKCDAIDPKDIPEIRSEFAARGVTLHAISAATGEGLDAVLEAVWQKLSPR